MGEVSESSARISIGPCEDGLSTSSTVKKTYSRPSMATRAVDCEASYESGWPRDASEDRVLHKQRGDQIVNRDPQPRANHTEEQNNARHCLGTMGRHLER